MILVSGAAGFIGSHVARVLLEADEHVVGVDNLNTYYDPALKRARLGTLTRYPRFKFVACDIAAPGALEDALPPGDATSIVHLAAQAGVRYSLEAPFSYEHSNVSGHLHVLEYARRAPNLTHLVYASSSSVYGDRTSGPFKESDRCDAPASLYAATKRACELMSETYAHLYRIPQTGLRFFTVYGPWGRPDMAVFSFTEKMFAGEPLSLFGNGLLARDYTFIDDIAMAVVRILARPPQGARLHEIYNLGNARPCTVLDLVAALEAATGIAAKTVLAPPQPGDVSVTFADHSRATDAFGYAPATPLEVGTRKFVEWYRGWRETRPAV